MPKCSICECHQNWFLLERKITLDVRNSWEGIENQKWFLCKKCGNLFPYPVTPKVAIKDAWDIARQDHYDDKFNIIDHMQKLDKTAMQVYNHFFPFIKGKKNILDIGCGYGNLVKILQNQGFKSYGIEVDSSTKTYHDQLKINTMIGQIEDLEIKRKFDVIFSVYSIYFFSNVKKFLVDIKKNLNDDGLLCIATANFLDSCNDEMPSSCHSFYPCKESMIALLAVTGFEVISIEKYKSSIFYVARKNSQVRIDDTIIPVNKIYFLYLTKKLRYLIIGLPIKKLGSLYHKIYSMLAR